MKLVRTITATVAAVITGAVLAPAAVAGPPVLSGGYAIGEAVTRSLHAVRTGPSTDTPYPYVVAHRGESGPYTENTIPAFQDAITHGARWIETDVRFTDDGVPVIMHDPTVDRTTDGTGAVSSMSLAQIEAVKENDGARVPTLAEFLANQKKYPGVRSFVELKDTSLTTAQWAAFDSAMQSSGVASLVVVTSFTPALLTEVKAHGYATGLIEGPGAESAANVLPYATYFLKAAASVTASSTAAWKSAGLKVYPWTVNVQADWMRFREYGVTGVLTDKATAYEDWAEPTCCGRIVGEPPALPVG